MRTAFLSSGRDSYGVRRSLEMLFRGFRHHGVEPAIICLQDGHMMDYAREVGVPSILCPIGTPPNFESVKDVLANFRFTFDHARELSKAIAGIGANNLIVRQPYQVPLAARAAHMARTPGYWLMPNLLSDKYPFKLNARLFDVILARYDMLAIANSDYTRTSLVGTFAKSAAAHLGIDPAEFRPDTPPAERANYGFAPGHALFGIFGRIWPLKGQLLFVEAVAEVIRDHPDIRLLLCGGPVDSDYGRQIASAIERLGLRGKVLLAGPSDALADSLPALYAMCDVVVNSRVDAEPFGLSVIEGMLMAKPLLVHALGGPGETVVDGQTGWLIHEPTAAGFAAGLQRAMTDRPNWPTLGAQARAHASANFSHTEAARRILAVMEANRAG